MGERETWATEEFGASHEGAIGVLLADGTVPAPVVRMSNSAGSGRSVSQWNVYNGRRWHGPRAAVLRAVCSCGWTGPEHPLDWDEIGDQDPLAADLDAPEDCSREWDEHITEVEASAIPLPDPLAALLAEVKEEIEKLAKSSPLAALRAARRLEVTAAETGYWAAYDLQEDMTVERAAAGLGLSEDAARKLVARFGRWSPYA